MTPRLQSGKVDQQEPDIRSELAEERRMKLLKGIRKGFLWEVVLELGFVG